MLSILHPAPIDTINSSPLRSPRKFSPRRLEWSFVFIERKLDGRTTRQYTPSTSLNIFIDKASPETTSQRTRVERLVPLQTHTAATHISADNKYSPAIKTAKSTKTRRMLLSDSPAKTTKTSINIAFLSPFHVKHRLKSHISTPLNPSALPHDRRHQTTKHIGQCKHASIVLPRSILRRFTYSAPLSL